MREDAGDVDYGMLGAGYARRRRTDPRIAAQVHAALGAARTVVNVGAGAGSYEPVGRYVIAIEPSAAMRAQRPEHLGPAIDAYAEALPLDDEAVDASMALVTIHQWADPIDGLAEMRRVTREPVVVLTFDPEALGRLWLMDYAPELEETEASRHPRISTITDALGPKTVVEPVPIPSDCADGFTRGVLRAPRGVPRGHRPPR